MRRPEIWNRHDPWARLAVAALTPAGWLHGATVSWNARNATPVSVGVPVICVGNLTVGGTGKTPIAVAIVQTLKARGRSPFFLSRGYGGSEPGPVLVTPEHSADQVGDEPVLMSTTAPVAVSRDRTKGAALAIANGADVIVMDDGHQNFSIAKDLSLVVVDGEQQFGNRRIVPAGPLRETVRHGMERADAVIIVGDGDPPLAGFCGPTLRVHLVHTDAPKLSGRRVVAFAGIGRPEKFFRSLRALGAEIVDAVAFADHHIFQQIEIAKLREKAAKESAQLVTTGKDYVRLPPEWRPGIAVLPVRAAFDDPGQLDGLLDRIVPAG
jgi:tetraacyldisaccharide 4'-kinase